MYRYDELVRVAKRENNTKRNYLVVNPSQGKHIPVSPTKALSLFDNLATLVNGKYSEEEILVIGFAETATAIGSQVAINLGAKYMQTTREPIPDVEYLFFSEEHSHATEQKLVKTDMDAVMGSVDRIIFVEDEITTGKTILNIIEVLGKAYSKSVKYTVLSLLNGMSEENVSQYKEKDIDILFLQKIDNTHFSETADSFKGDGVYVEKNAEPAGVASLEIKGAVNARRLVDADDYKNACEQLFETVFATIPGAENMLVVGTEECMYPALFVGRKYEEKGAFVRSHSTTRSPIAVSTENEYPLNTRYELASLYDDERKTFIYDIAKYDKVIIVTDAQSAESKGINSLVNALSRSNDNIVLVRWIY